MGGFFPIYSGGGGGQPQPNNAFINAQLVGDTLEFTKGDGTHVRVPLSDFAKLDEVNDFTKDNWFEDVILSKTDSLLTDGMGVLANPTRNRYIGVRRHSSNEFDGYISHIKILCDENTVLHHVTNVKVYSIRKGANVNDDRVTELLVDNGSFEIKTDGGKHIIIPINKKFVDDTYFVVYDNSVQPVLKARNNVDVALHPDIVNTAIEPQIGQAPVNIDARYVYDMTLYGGLSVKETLLSAYVDSHYDQATGELTLIKADGTETNYSLAIGGGTVTDVNGVAPVGGNVTVGIANIQGLQNALDNKVNTSEVGNENNKIPRLNNGKLVDDIIPELAITRIIDVVNQADALAKVNSRDIQVGDSVRLTGEENKVYQYTGNAAGSFTDRFIEISLGDETVRTVNNQKPTLGGNITVNAGQINASVENQVKSVQDHMNEMYTNISNTRTIANENRARINVLETKQPYYNVGDIVPTFKNSGNGYKVAGCAFMYCGTSQVLSRTDYPDFCDALGYSASTTRFDTPVIRDESILITNGKYATKRYYVCIKNN